MPDGASKGWSTCTTCGVRSWSEEERMDVEAGPGLTQPVPARVVEILRGTRPWVKLLSIVGFVTVGLIVVMGLFVLVAAPWMDEGPFFGVLMCLFYFVLAVVYF